MLSKKNRIRLMVFVLTFTMLFGLIPVSAAGKKTVKPSQPKIGVTASLQGNDKVNVVVTIEKTKNAEGFEIYEKKSGDSGYTKIYTVKEAGTQKREYSKEYSVSDKAVSIKVRAYNGTTTGKYSSVKKVDLKAYKKTETKTVKADQTKNNGSNNSDTTKSSNSKTVYITKTGSKYHSKKCGNGTYTAVDIEEAKKKGLEPCKKCIK